MNREKEDISAPPGDADCPVGPRQVDGLLEDWIWQLVAALKSQLAQPVNVALADWISLAQNHYAIAVRNTRLVGQEVAAILRWLEVRPAHLPSSPFPSLPLRGQVHQLVSNPSPDGRTSLPHSQEWKGPGPRPLAPHPHPLFFSSHPTHYSFYVQPLDALRDLNTPWQPPNPTHMNRWGRFCRALISGEDGQAGGSSTRQGPGR